VDKTYLLNLIKRLKILYCVDVLGFALMGNHFHLVVRMYPEDEFLDEEIIKRHKEYYGDDKYLAKEQVSEVRKRLCSLAAYVKDIKQGFTRYYNKKYNRRGYFWGDRFTQLNKPQVYGTAVFNWVNRCRDHRLPGVRPPGIRTLPGYHKGQTGTKAAQDPGLGSGLLSEAPGNVSNADLSPLLFTVDWL
jgi:hypothetical protein